MKLRRMKLSMVFPFISDLKIPVHFFYKISIPILKGFSPKDYKNKSSLLLWHTSRGEWFFFQLFIGNWRKKKIKLSSWSSIWNYIVKSSDNYWNKFPSLRKQSYKIRLSNFWSFHVGSCCSHGKLLTLLWTKSIWNCNQSFVPIRFYDTIEPENL